MIMFLLEVLIYEMIAFNLIVMCVLSVRKVFLFKNKLRRDKLSGELKICVLPKSFI